MTYKEKYNELFLGYEDAIKNLQNATQKLSSDIGLGSDSDLDNYYKINQQYKRAEVNFQQFLKYWNADDINPDTDFLLPTHMYNVIIEDSKKQGYTVHGYKIDITNDGSVKELFKRTEYKFPVLNLEHGKECHNYISGKLISNKNFDDTEIDDIEFDIDKNKQIYIVVITTWK